jgi:hypothetical protein
MKRAATGSVFDQVAVIHMPFQPGASNSQLN